VEAAARYGITQESARRIVELRRKIDQQALDLDSLTRGLKAYKGFKPEEHRLARQHLRPGMQVAMTVATENPSRIIAHVCFQLHPSG